MTEKGMAPLARRTEREILHSPSVFASAPPSTALRSSFVYAALRSGQGSGQGSGFAQNDRSGKFRMTESLSHEAILCLYRHQSIGNPVYECDE
jgi:hypothetical protein